MIALRLLLVMAIIAGTIPCCQARPRKAAARERAETELGQLFETCFPRWDSSHDGTLSLSEINTLIENPQVRGDEAAAAVVVRQRFAPKGEESDFQGLSQAQLLAFASDPEAAHSFSKVRNRIKSVNRTLFLPADPNLLTFHQGGVGDCYLLSVIAALVNRDPQAVRAMIKPLPNGDHEVYFANSKTVSVAPPTDAEVVMGAREKSNRGIWLSVLEKAYAAVREEKRENLTGKVIADDEVVTKDLLGGGRSGPAIVLFTGHQAASVPVGRWAGQSVQQAAGRLHELLIQLTGERRLITAGTGKNTDNQLPKHIPYGHVCAVLGYDSNRRMVRVFNPWGNDATPNGPAGLVNGYVTRDGVFEVPLQEFVQIFGSLTYEAGESSGN